MTDTPNRGIPYVPEGTLDPAAGLNIALDVIDPLLQTAVISMDQTAPPTSSVDGDLYIVAPSGATGAWAGKENYLARYRFEGDFWQFYAPDEQVALVLNSADGGLYKWLEGSPGGWTLAAGLSDAPIDGELYARRDGLWEAITSGLTVIGSDESPAVIEVGVELLRFFGATVEIAAPGVVDVTIDAPGTGATVLTENNETATFPNSRQLLAGTGITFDDSVAGERTIESSGGGGGSLVGAPLAWPNLTFGTDLPNWPGYTAWKLLRGKRLLTVCSSFKVRLQVASGTFNFAAITLRRTLAGDTTFIDSTVVSFGGDTTPSLAAGFHDSDEINVAVDIDHDYHLLLYVDPSTSSAATLKQGTDTTATVQGGYKFGDHTAAADLSGFTGPSQAYSELEWFVAS